MADRFAANLRKAREEAGLSQEELAFRADIHRTQISMIEGGRRMPRLDTLVKLAGGLEVEVSDLVAGISWRPSKPRHGDFVVGPDGGEDAAEEE